MITLPLRVFCSSEARTVKPILHRVCQFDCLTWAEEVMDFLNANFTKSERFTVIKPVTNLASEMLSHLLIASMAFHSTGLIGVCRSSKKLEILEGRRPRKTVRNRPADYNDIRGIPSLLEEATTKKSHSALKELGCYSYL
jgi:hypothetical protein